MWFKIQVMIRVYRVQLLKLSSTMVLRAMSYPHRLGIGITERITQDTLLNAIV